MTAKICSSVTAKVIQRLAAPGGPFSGRPVRSENVAAELAERSDALQYPAIYVYCEKAVNTLAENTFPAVVPSPALSRCGRSRSTSTAGSVRPE